jgi:hypothetical protein
MTGLFRIPPSVPGRKSNLSHRPVHTAGNPRLLPDSVAASIFWLDQ